MSTWPHAWVPTPQIGNSCGQPPNFDDVTFPSPQPACHHGVPSTCVGLVTLGSNFTCRQQSVGPCQTTPPHQPLAPCLLATAWVTAHGVQLYPAPCISQAATGLEWAAPAVVASTAVPPPGSRTVPRSLVCAQALSGRRLNGGTIAASCHS